MRVAIYDIAPDGAHRFRRYDDLAAVLPEASGRREAEQRLIVLGRHEIAGPDGTRIALVRPSVEEMALIVTICERARDLLDNPDFQDAPIAVLAAKLVAAHFNGAPLRLRDLAAADDADVIHDVMGIKRNVIPFTGSLHLTAFVPRYLDHDRLSGADRGPFWLALLAADVPPPWRIDDAEVEPFGNLLIRDAENGYVAEIDPDRLDNAGVVGVERAREIGALILQAVNHPSRTETTEKPYA